VKHKKLNKHLQNRETKPKILQIILVVLIVLFLFIQQWQISSFYTRIESEEFRQQLAQVALRQFLLKNYGVSSIEELEQKLKQRYTGNPFTTSLYPGQLQTENLTFMHSYWYDPSTGKLINVTDLAAYPIIPISYVVWTDGSLVYAKNGSTGRRVFTGDTYTVLNSIKNTLKTSGGGSIFLYAGNYTLTSTFPDENVSSTIIMYGSGRSTRLLPSGSFDAVNTSLIQIRDLVWQDASGTLYDATFDPNMFQQALRTELNSANITVQQLNYTQLLSTNVPPFYPKVKAGYAFSGSKRFESVSSDANFSVLIENPSGSGKDVVILSIAIIGLAQCYVDIYDDVSVTSYGNNMTIRNLNLESTNTNVCGAYYGGTYSISGAEKVHETIVPGGSKQFAIGGLSEVGESVIVPSGHNILVVVTNKSSSASDFAVQILWSENLI